MDTLKTEIEELNKGVARAVAEYRNLNEKIEKENRKPTAEEAEQMDRVLADAEEKRNLASEKQNELRRRDTLAANEEWLSSSCGRKTGPSNATYRTTDKSEFRNAAFNKYLRYGKSNLDHSEFRALAQDDDNTGDNLWQGGGYLNPPQAFNSKMIKAIDNYLFAMNFVQRVSLSGAPTVRFPVLAADPEDGTWTTEIATVDADTQMEISYKEITPEQVSKQIKVSMKLLDISAFNVEQFIIDRLAYKFAVTFEKGILNGSGASQEPLGIFTASDNGIPTSRDVTTSATAAIKADDIYNAKYSINSAYWPGLRWVFGRTSLKMVAKLKDGEGRYMWQTALAAGQPDTLLGIPVDVSEYVVGSDTGNAWQTGDYAAALCNWNDYLWVELLPLRVQRFDELYAANSQVGIAMRTYATGTPVNSGAGFARLKLA